MIYHFLLCFASLALDVVASIRLAPDEKDIQIALLRQQLRVLERKAKTIPRLSRPEKLMLVALMTRLQLQTRQWQQRVRDAILLVQPKTVLKWHRELVQREWTFRQPRRGGRPRLDSEIEALIIRIASENSRVGYDKLQGELLKLGFAVDPTTIKNVLRRHRLLPAPKRGRSAWRSFLKNYRGQMLACDFFTVETLPMQPLYMLFFIVLGSRRVHLAGCTTNPDNAWVELPARQLVWLLDETKTPMCFLIHDRDSKFTALFDQVFVSDGIETVRTPFRAPKANAVAERWVRSIRQECLGHLLILNQRHLLRVLKEYTTYYNAARPHQGIHRQAPIPFSSQSRGNLHCRDVLGGILHNYYSDAA